MTPESTQITTNNSSLQVSPDGPRGRELESSLPTPLELPEAIIPPVSRKSSHNAMSEAMAISKSPGLMRRFSNKASQFARGRRRQSSNHAGRDHSTGPFIMRRRSDSTNTAPETLRGNSFLESDDEQLSYYEEPVSLLNLDNLDYTSSTTATITTTSMPVSPPSSPGPVIPGLLLQGTGMVKVSKKRRKQMKFVLDNESAKVTWGPWDRRSWKQFYIDDIKEIRLCEDARNYREELGVSLDDEPRFFTILYAVPDRSKGRSTKLMHLIAQSEEILELWTTTLDAISKHRQELMTSLSSFNEKAVKQYWQGEMNRQFQDRPHSAANETLDIVGVERLCRSLHIHGSANYLRAKFDQADRNRRGRLDFNAFQDFVNYMKQREDVRAIYRELSSDVPKGMTLEDFLVFLRDIQLEDIDDRRVHWENAFAKFARRPRTKDSDQQTADIEVPRMNESALASYLISTLNIPKHNKPAEYSLDRPLNEYFISSSHNTYLLGRQVVGQSSVEAYISALNKGCRCVEVDCWDGKDGQPIVMHGHSLTTHVSFADVMSAISKYAFAKSPYPLWVSLEVHCSPQQQERMAEIIKSKCGDKLLTQPLEGFTDQLPSPSQLREKILIKVKKPRPDVEPSEQYGRRRGNSLTSPYMKPLQVDNSTIPPNSLPANGYPRTGRFVNHNHARNNGNETMDSLTTSASESEFNTDDVARAQDSKNRYKTSNIIKVLGELGVYSMGLKFHGWDNPEGRSYNHIYSFMESTFDKNSRTTMDRHNISRHNMRHMMRVYPNGLRVASSNFDPLKYWRRGVQMTALNWQTYDLGMQMNDAMFASGTDQSGYVLKPVELREIQVLPHVPEEARIGAMKRERKNVNFSIDVISAQQLMRPKGLGPHRSVDPYIEVEVYHADDKTKDSKGVVGEGGLDASGKDGLSGLGAPHRRRTQIVQENGFNPIFDKKFNFDLTTKYPELVFVRFTVRCSPDGQNYSDRGPALATYTAKLGSMKQGYRTLPLFDNNGDQFLFSTLFCRIKIEAATSIFINPPEAYQSPNVLKAIGRSVFNRTPMSPKSSMDSGHQ